MNGHAMVFVQDLAVIMLIAGIATVLCQRFKQPLVLGYILAGIFIGPHTPPFTYINDEIIINTLAELGVVFLMFSLGLEFNIRKLSEVGKVAFITASLEILVMLALGYQTGILMGWEPIDALFLGAILAISSTTIIVKALSELNLKNDKFAHIVFGILIVEDVFAILILTLLSSIAIKGQLEIQDVLIKATELTSFLIVSVMLGILIIPRILKYIASFNSDEVLLISVLGLCFGFCLIVIKLNYSVALGAFIIGTIIAESSALTKIEYLIQPIRDMFSAIFFVSVGLIFNPTIIAEYTLPIVAITTLVIIGKVFSSSLGVLISGYSGRDSMRVGMSLAQIGEFSFIIASLGIALDVTDNYLFSIAVCVSIITTLTTPYLIKLSDPFATYMGRYIPDNISTTFQVYSAWIQNINLTDEQLAIKKIINTVILHIVVNSFVVISFFLMGTYLANSAFGDRIIDITNDYIQHAVIWSLALVCSLPFLIAAFRKTKALGMVLAEVNMKESSGLTVNNRLIVSELIQIMYVLLMLTVISVISASILPTLEMLALILMLAGALVIFVLPWLIRIHSRLQISLMDVMKK